MFTRVLTDLERRQIRAYLKADGERSHAVVVLVSRAKKHIPQIDEDLLLLKRLLSTYDKHLNR